MLGIGAIIDISEENYFLTELSAYTNRIKKLLSMTAQFVVLQISQTHTSWRQEINFDYELSKSQVVDEHGKLYLRLRTGKDHNWEQKKTLSGTSIIFGFAIIVLGLLQIYLFKLLTFQNKFKPLIGNKKMKINIKSINIILTLFFFPYTSISLSQNIADLKPLQPISKWINNKKKKYSSNIYTSRYYEETTSYPKIWIYYF